MVRELVGSWMWMVEDERWRVWSFCGVSSLRMSFASVLLAARKDEQKIFGSTSRDTTLS